MKRREFIACCGASALSGIALQGCSGGQSGENTRHLVDTPEKRAEYLHTMLKRICTDIGPHPSGTPEYDRAAQIILSEMTAALPKAEQQNYIFGSWEQVHPPELSIDGKSLEAYSCMGCTSTALSGFNGYVVKSDEKGAAFDFYDYESGVKEGYICVSPYGRAVPQTAHGIGSKHLPVINIGKQDVHILETASEKKLPVFLKVQINFLEGKDSSNIIGTLPGKSEDEILLIAHADTVYSSPGANDNTASLITMLMLAHAFSGTRQKYTLRFLATGGEEYNFIGSKRYSQDRLSRNTMKNIKHIINFDSLTYGPNIMAYTIDKSIQSMLLSIDKDLNLPGTPKMHDSDGFRLDSLTFKKSGARAVFINSRGYDEKTLKLWHRPEDTADTVHVDCVENSFLLFREYIKRLQEV